MAGELKTGSVKTFACPNCGGKVEIHAPGQTLAAACQYCQSSIDITDPNFKILKTYRNKLEFKPRIPIGTRGELSGIPWEVIGFMVRRSLKYHINWEEYLLFNPIHGFRWLIQDSGHWSLYRSITDKPLTHPYSRSVQLHGRTYKSYSSGEVSVQFVLGEFYWRVERGEKVNVQDYISPPYVLSLEKEESGIHWALGEYIQPKEVREAFGDQVKLPRRVGVGMNQPNPHRENLRQTLPIAGLLIALLVLMKIIFVPVAKNETIFSKQYTLTTQDSTFAVEKFTIEGRKSNVEVRLLSDVDNNWMEVEGILSLEKENQNFGFRTGTEYYHGISDGESWREGGQKNSVLINLVPSGEYSLLLNAYTQAKLGQPGSQQAYKPVSFRLTIKRDVPLGSNFFIILVLLLIYPGFQFFRSLQFEKIREES